MVDSDTILQTVKQRLDPQRFRKHHWEGSFADYLKLVSERPDIARNAFQRIYDMILHFGTERYTRLRKELTRYNFFSDPMGGGEDAIYGLDQALMNLVDFFKSAAQGYGTERRIRLLHGPVGSSKSTITRLVKKGLEYYSRLDEGALYTFYWNLPDKEGNPVRYDCPMHEEPLKLIPTEARDDVLAAINADLAESRRIRIDGALDPFCRSVFEELLMNYDGDWTKVMDHITVRRLVLSEKDRRRYAAIEAEKLGHGGIRYVAELFGCDPDTIRRGSQDIEELPTDEAEGRIRKKGRTKNS